MPCMGPDLEEARRNGHLVGSRLLEELIKENQLHALTIVGMKIGNYAPGALERWMNAEHKFVAAVGELFVEHAANGF